MPLQRLSGIVTAQQIAVKNQVVKLRDGESARFQTLIRLRARLLLKADAPAEKGAVT